MENLSITWETILVIAGGVIVLIDAYKRVISMTKPISDLKAKQYDIGEKIKNNESRISTLEREVSGIREYQEKSSAVIGLAVAELLNHLITGNDVEKLKEKEDKLNEFFYNKDG